MDGLISNTHGLIEHYVNMILRKKTARGLPLRSGLRVPPTKLITQDVQNVCVQLMIAVEKTSKIILNSFSHLP
jgi:hypothetical protein